VRSLEVDGSISSFFMDCKVDVLIVHDKVQRFARYPVRIADVSGYTGASRWPIRSRQQLTN